MHLAAERDNLDIGMYVFTTGSNRTREKYGMEGILILHLGPIIIVMSLNSSQDAVKSKDSRV